MSELIKARMKSKKKGGNVYELDPHDFEETKDQKSTSSKQNVTVLSQELSPGKSDQVGFNVSRDENDENDAKPPPALMPPNAAISL